MKSTFSLLLPLLDNGCKPAEFSSLLLETAKLSLSKLTDCLTWLVWKVGDVFTRIITTPTNNCWQFEVFCIVLQKCNRN